MMADFEASDALPTSSSSSAAASLAAAPGKKSASSVGGKVVIVDESFKPHAELFTAPFPTRKADRTLVFKDHPEF